MVVPLLPPVGWADVATKEDLRNLEERLNLRMEAMESRLVGWIKDELSGVKGRMIKTTLIANISTMLGTAGLVLAAVRLG